MKILSVKYEVGDFVKIQTKEWFDKNGKYNKILNSYTYLSESSKYVDILDVNLCGKTGEIIEIDNKREDKVVYKIKIEDNSEREDKELLLSNLDILIPIPPVLKAIYKFCSDCCIYQCRKDCTFYKLINEQNEN